MSKTVAKMSALLLLVGLVVLAGCSDPTKRVVGTWQGALKIQQGMELKINFNITKQDDGKLAATLDSPDQGALKIGLDAVTFADDTLKMEVKGLPGGGGSFEGKVNKDGTQIDGQWKQSGMTLPITLKRAGGDSK